MLEPARKTNDGREEGWIDAAVYPGTWEHWFASWGAFYA